MACYQCLHHENALKGMDQLKVRALDSKEITPEATVKQTATPIVTPNKQSPAKQIIRCPIVCFQQQQTIIAVDQSERKLIGIKEVGAIRSKMEHQLFKANLLPTLNTFLLILLGKIYQEIHHLKPPTLQ